MSEQFKPTNEEIAEYIYDWHVRLSNIPLRDALEILNRNKFVFLRELFAPEMYNSIQEYVDKEK